MAKTKKIDTRLTEEEKELIVNYCKKHNIKPSTFLRECALMKIGENKKKENK